ncbi:MAG: ATP-binding protein [Methylacidiphilales bacterium]|nr:ATP-binding protein [Candidatus Methylacidiphilales bacterium]
MDKYRTWSLWLRIAIPFLLFVVIGSIVLCAWLYLNAQQESHTEFATLARVNAGFIHSSRLPTTERMAQELGRILDLDVYFRQTGKEIIPPLPGDLKKRGASISSLSPADGVVQLESSIEAVSAPIDATCDLIFIRPVQKFELLQRPLTLVILLSFWVLSLVLAWTLTRGVVRPLRILASRLPHIETDDVLSLPGMERDDEIGLLARAYHQTHSQLSLERQRREKAERLALLGRMATGLAHEINNPVSAIRMHLQLMEASKKLDTSAIPLILGETAKIESLINQWMFLTRPAPPQISTANIGELVASVVKSLQLQADHARVTIAVDIAPGLHAEVDARRISQALGNIILNAIQAMPSGGTLRITGHADNGNALLTFADTGRGFSENALQHYADLFYSEKEGGMGIGLSVSAEIIKAHGGAIEVANLPAGGACVSLALPASNPS